MYYVYLIQSESDPSQRYVGYTTNVAERILKHNEGGSPHTSKFRPWRLIAYFAFEDQKVAVAFEKYLKSGSGKAFANKHLWTSKHP